MSTQFDLFKYNAAVHSEFFGDLKPEVVEKFWEYHKDNPKVFELLETFARQVLAAGRKYYSVYALFERIRWHTMIETRGDDFKINNNYRACYARLLILKYPEFDGFFETRRSHYCEE